MNAQFWGLDGAICPLLLAALSLSLVPTSGCGDDSTSQRSGPEYVAVDSDDVHSAPRCYGVDIQRHSARPFERVDVELDIFSGDSDVDDIEAFRGVFGVDIEYDDGQQWFLPVYYDADEQHHYFIAPHHPEGIGGGPATLHFTDGETTCEESLPWTVESIDRAPGTLTELIEASTQLTRELARSYGYEPQQLLDTPTDELPPPLIPLAFHIWALDHPDNPHSLKAGLENGELPVEFDDNDLEIVEAFLAEAGLVENLQRSLESLEQLEPPSGFDATLLRQSPLRTDDIDTTAQPLCSFADDRFTVDIQTADELSHYMIKADLAESLGEQVEIASNLAGLVSVVPGPTGVVGALMGLIFAIDQLMRSAHANTLPRYLTEPRVDQWIPSFFEDYTEPKSWSHYRVDAYTDGWDATADIADALIEFAFSVTGAAGGAVRIINRATDRIDLPPSMADELRDNLQRFVAQNATRAGMDTILDGSGFCVIEPGPWPDIDIRTQLLEARYDGSIGTRHGDQFSLDDFCYDDHHQGQDISYYEPLALGPGQIKVNADPSYFPPGYNRQLSRWRGDVTVYPGDVDIPHDDRSADPGDVVTLRGEIDHLWDRSGRWKVRTDAGKIIDTDDDVEGNHRADIQLPSSTDDFPVIVSLKSTADTGLRHSDCNPPPRHHLAIIRSDEELRIEPQFRCIEEGGQLQYEAHVSVAESDPDIQWSASGGSIDDRGLFQASDIGEFTIEATVDGYDLQDDAHLRVGPCECFHHVSLTGGISGSFSATGTTSAIYDAEDFGVFLDQPGQDNSGTVRPRFHLSNTWFGSPAGGSFQFAELAGGAFEGVSVSVDNDAGWLAVDHWSDEDYVQGRFVGQANPIGVETRNAPGQPPTTVDLPATEVTVEFMATASDPGMGAFSNECAAGSMPSMPSFP